MKTKTFAEEKPDQLKELSARLRKSLPSIEIYLAQLEKLFSEREPWVKAFLPEEYRFGRLRKDLFDLESQFPDKNSRPPLYGIPVGVKDIFHVKGFITRAGSRVPSEVIQGPEAKSVTMLKSAGALIMGKTVTTEFASFAPGVTCNPHNINHTPGGSSSGSAAAVSAGLSPIALGTQTGASILRPASYCGVVGFKPSYGRISTEGVIPLAPSLDHVGFIAADVEGAILVSSILCEGWKDSIEIPKPVFGVPEGPYLGKAGKEGLQHFRKTCKRLSDDGFEIRSLEMLKDFDELNKNNMALLAGEAALVHQEWFGRYSEYYRNETAEFIRKGQSIKPHDLSLYRANSVELRNEILKSMMENNISALLTPGASGPAPFGLQSTGDPIMNMIWTYTGLPVVGIPSGKTEMGLPIGLQIVGSWWGDEFLLEIARQVAKYISLF